MKWKTVKKESEVALSGVKVSFDVQSDQLISVVLSDGVNLLKVAKHGYDNIRAFVPEVEERYAVRFSLHGYDVGREFDEREDAETEARRLRNLGVEVEDVKKEPCQRTEKDDGIPF